MRKLFRTEYFTTVNSTNDICRERASRGEADGYIAIASAQTGGRGRRGRTFFSPDGSGLYMSILYRPSELSTSLAPRLTTAAAVATAEVLEEISGRQSLIKWVNDIYMDGRKVSGILTEAEISPDGKTLSYAVIGIGINLYRPEDGFPEEIRDSAGSVFEEEVYGSSRSSDRTELAVRIAERLYDLLRDIEEEKPSYTAEYRRRCFVTGRCITVIRPGREPEAATALEIDKECRLLVRYTDGRSEWLSSGEVSIRQQQPDTP